MTGETVDALTPYLQDEVGESLRGIVLYDATEYEIRYIRDDLRTHRLKSEVDTMIKRVQRESRPAERQAFPFGEMNGSIRSFEEAMVLHLPDTHGRGTIVTLDPEVAHQLNTFIEAVEPAPTGDHS